MLFTALSLLAASGTLSSAIVADLSPAYTATIESTYPDGRVSKLWLEPDGTFTALGRHNDSTGGRWTVTGNNICLKQMKPFPIPFARYCAPLPKEGVAAQGWTGKAVTGEPIKIRLVPGR